MLGYKLKALSVNINGRVYKKEEGFTFNEKNTDKAQLKNAIDGGFLEPIDPKAAEAEAEAAELQAKKEKAEKDAIAEVKVEAKAKAEKEIKKDKKIK